jgi:ketosteroid isomerase-like protein
VSIAVKEEIREIVNRETEAWNNQNIEKLMSLFHPDMVWPWPRTESSHDPMDWVLELGRFDYDRWKKGWLDLFASHQLIYNNRKIQKIVVSKEGDGAFAVVDVDTLWRRLDNGKDFHWKGRACKIYTTVNGVWKMIGHTGLLQY